MIDYEAEVYDYIASRALEAFPGLYVTGEYVPSPPSFPCLVIMELDNFALAGSQSADNMENHAVVLYEIAVYSNLTTGRKAQCRSIAAFADRLMTGLNFTRTMLEPVPNLNDATIYRMVGRYRAVIGEDGTIYRNS